MSEEENESVLTDEETITIGRLVGICDIKHIDWKPVCKIIQRLEALVIAHRLAANSQEAIDIFLDNSMAKGLGEELIRMKKDLRAKCEKVPHTGIGYLHDESDDGPYDVDGVKYCGRCHRYGCDGRESNPPPSGVEGK